MLEWLQSIGSSGPSDLPSTNEEWVSALRDQDPAAVEELRAILVRGLKAALKERVPRQVDALAEDFAQEALVKILDKLDTFRGESKLTTWAQKIAVRTAFTELRRKRWENVSLQDVVSDEEEGPTIPDAAVSSNVDADPEESASQRLLTDRVKQTLQEVLTDRQRTVIQAVMQGMPLEEVARRMDTNRNALYKVIYDARQKLKAALEEQGISEDQLLAEIDSAPR